MTEDAYALMAGTYDVHTNYRYYLPGQGLRQQGPRRGPRARLGEEALPEGADSPAPLSRPAAHDGAPQPVYLVLALLAACLASAAYALGRRIPGGRACGAGFDAASERALEALGAGMIVVGRHGRGSAATPRPASSSASRDRLGDGSQRGVGFVPHPSRLARNARAFQYSLSLGRAGPSSSWARERAGD